MTHGPGRKASGITQSVAPQHALQRATLNAEDARRARDVAAGLLKHVRQVAALHFFERGRATEERRVDRRLELGSQVIGREDLAACERDRSLDAVLELSD